MYGKKFILNLVLKKGKLKRINKDLKDMDPDKENFYDLIPDLNYKIKERNVFSSDTDDVNLKVCPNCGIIFVISYRIDNQ